MLFKHKTAQFTFHLLLLPAMSRIPIYFHTDGISFNLPKKTLTREWIKAVIEEEGKQCSEINFIFCSDSYLHALNLKYLKHDEFTDIITFDYCENDLISGDVFISVESTRDNAKRLNINHIDEIHRVMVHGILHLIGYEDKPPPKKAKMIEKEDYYLSLRPF